MLMGTLDGVSCEWNGDLVSFSTAFIPDWCWCWDLGGRPDGEVANSVNLTKILGRPDMLSRAAECERPWQVGGYT